MALKSGQVKAVKIHHLGPGSNKVLHKLFLSIFTRIDFSDCPSSEFEPKIRSTRVPVHLASPVLRSRPSNTSLVFRSRFPLCLQIEQVHKEVISERARTFSENTVFGLIEVRIQEPAFRQQEPSFPVRLESATVHGRPAFLRRRQYSTFFCSSGIHLQMAQVAKDSTSVCSCDASARPGVNGTFISWPAFFAAFSMPAHPPRTIRSASETFLPPDCALLNSFWIPSRVFQHLRQVEPDC